MSMGHARQRTARGYVGRASRTPGQLWQVPTFFGGLLAFLAVAVTAPSRQDATIPEFHAELASLRRGLVRDQEKPAVLSAAAENLLGRLPQLPQLAGEIHFLAGSAYFRQAGQGPPEKQSEHHNKAIKHLEEALTRGVPVGDMAPLQFRLGYSLYQQGKDVKRAIDLMAQAVDKGADRPAQGHGVLVQAYLALPQPDVDAALRASQRQLELSDDRNLEDMARARLTHAELLVRKERRQEAFKELERIGPAAPRQVRLKARVLQTRLCEEEGLWNRAIPVWKELLKDADFVAGGKARVLHALGLAYCHADPPRTDEAMAAWEEALALGGSEADAAGLRLGEMRLYGPRAGAPAALAIWSKVLANVRTPTDYKIEALDIDSVRDIFENAYRYFLESHEHELSRQVAELYKKIAMPGIADERIAQAAEGLARSLKDKALASPGSPQTLEEARAQYHRAAVAYEEAATARAREAQASLYWSSARCYVAARDYTHAGNVLGKFVQIEQDEARLAEAWLLLADAHVALGNKESARQAYCKCIEYPLTPFAFRARYELAVDEMAKKNYEQARAILQQNLTSPARTQDPSAHEKSIFKMAELVFAMQDFDKAALYYKEASRRYPLNAGVLTARDQLANCYARLADKAKDKMLAAKEEEAKVYHERTWLDFLEQGAVIYQGLADDLEHRARQQPLKPYELGLLRKALFGAADLRFEMNEFDESLRRYQVLQEKYRVQVEGLIACQRIWRCVGSMVSSPEQSKLARAAALAALKAAEADLESMPEETEGFQGGMGVYTKAEWQRYLGWIKERLSK